MIEHMVVLANSRKAGGCCIAGRALDANARPGRWLRPVGRDAADGLPPQRTRCADGNTARVLDLIEIDLAAAVPRAHQQENRLLGDTPWARCGRVDWNGLAALADAKSAGLWVDGFSSRCGNNDQVPDTLLGHITESLRLIRTDHLHLCNTTNAFGRRQLRGTFSHAGRDYTLAVTDPVAWAALAGIDQLTLPDVYLCISLALPFNGYAYKLVASVITEHRVRTPA